MKFVIFICFFYCLSNPFLKAQDKDPLVVLKLIPVFNNETLILNYGTYVTDKKDTINIDVFKFYLSSLSFQSEKVSALINQKSLLVDVEDTLSLTLKLNLKKGTFSYFEMLIGTDSITNVSGAMDGDLDPIKGMYWAWNTGYINAKMEGRFKNNSTIQKKFEFHIGGYLKPFESCRKIKINFPETTINNNDIFILECFIDASYWFNNKNTIGLTSLNKIVHPCKESVQISENYSGMIRYKTSYVVKEKK
jgi:hypothetical protein